MSALTNIDCLELRIEKRRLNGTDPYATIIPESSPLCPGETVHGRVNQEVAKLGQLIHEMNQKLNEVFQFNSGLEEIVAKLRVENTGLKRNNQGLNNLLIHYKSVIGEHEKRVHVTERQNSQLLEINRALNERIDRLSDLERQNGQLLEQNRLLKERLDQLSKPDEITVVTVSREVPTRGRRESPLNYRGMASPSPSTPSAEFNSGNSV